VANNPLVSTLADLHRRAEALEVYMGTVMSFTLASSTTATLFEVDLEGAGNATPGVLACASYAQNTTQPPAVGDTVMVLRHQSTLTIIDRVS
jgi:hypothetical protein